MFASIDEFILHDSVECAEDSVMTSDLNVIQGHHILAIRLRLGIQSVKFNIDETQVLNVTTNSLILNHYDKALSRHDLNAVDRSLQSWDLDGLPHELLVQSECLLVCARLFH